MGKRILLINDRLHGGGAERVAQLLARELAADGAELTVWSAEGDEETLRAWYPAGTSWRRLPVLDRPCRRFSARWLADRFRRALYEGLLLRLRSWDLVLAMKEGPSMRLAAALRARRKLAWVHTDYKTLHWSRFFFRGEAEELRCMRSFDAVACVSGTVRRGILETLGDPGNLRVLYNPIDAAAIREKAAQACPEAERPASEGPLLVAIGRLDPGKRMDMLAACAERLHREHPFTLRIIGGGPGWDALREQVRDLGFIELLGARDNPYPFLARADWLVSASESESYGLAVQEALILGVPVLACACGGVAESLDARFGLLTGLEPEALEAALRRALTEPGLAEGFRAAIRRDYDAEALYAPRLEEIRRAIDG